MFLGVRRLLSQGLPTNLVCTIPKNAEQYPAPIIIAR